MNFKYWLILIITFFCFGYSFADTTTVVLQNGLGGYSGCEDSYNFTEKPDTNFSNYEKIQIFNCIP